jgi:hypothetical protein
VEWSIGEAVGLLVRYAGLKNVLPRALREDAGLLAGFQEFLKGKEIELEWKG